METIGGNTGSMREVDGLDIICTLINLAVLAMTQRSRTTDFCRMSGNVFGTTTNTYRVSPIVCLFDAIEEACSLIQQAFRCIVPKKEDSDTADAEKAIMSLTEKDEKANLEDTPRQEVHLVEYTRSRSTIVMRLAALVIVVLPQTIRLLACDGIFAARICAGVFLAAIVVHELRAVLPEMVSQKQAVPQTKDVAKLVEATRYPMAQFHALGYGSMWVAIAYVLSGRLQEGFDVQELCRRASTILQAGLLGSWLIALVVVMILPQRLRPSSSWLIPLHCVLGLAEILDYPRQTSSSPAQNYQLPTRDFGTIYLKASQASVFAMSVPVLISLGLGYLLCWLTNLLPEKDGEEIQLKKSIMIPPMKALTWHSQYTLVNYIIDGLNIFGGFAYVVFSHFRTAEVAGYWYLLINAQVQQIAFIVFNVLSLGAYYLVVYNSKGTSWPAWSHSTIYV